MHLTAKVVAVHDGSKYDDGKRSVTLRFDKCRERGAWAEITVPDETHSLALGAEVVMPVELAVSIEQGVLL